MTKIIDLSGKGAAISGVENDANLSTLSGINVVDATTSRTVDIDDQGATIEFTNAGAIAVTLDSMATIAAALHTDDFTVTLLATGAGAVTITPNGLNSFNSGVATIVLAVDDYVTLQTDGTQLIWNIIGDNVKTWTETQTNKTLTSPVLNTGVSGTALETTLTNDDTVLPTSGAVFDKVGGLNIKIVDIGDWDMNADSQHTVAHGLTWTDIRTIEVTIRDDVPQIINNLSARVTESGSGQIGISANATNVILDRSLGGAFDNSGYASPPSSNRGWIIIQYVD